MLDTRSGQAKLSSLFPKRPFDTPMPPVVFKETLNLPDTAFPMRANLATREPARYAHWQKIGLYQAMQDDRRDAATYILHDGPPFTNGDVHIGTALNKILKDIIIRHRTMTGWRAPYVPGWDCHGLPIEHKVSQQLQKEGKVLSPLEVRQACAAFSNRYIEIQRAQFQRLGILGDWAGEYRTMDPAYEAQILRTFAAFVEQGLVYRSKKPVYWSIACQTALAEAEIEYKDHLSPSIWVNFPFDRSELARLGTSLSGRDDDRLGVAIWTTTPWTLPANLAIAVHPDFNYVLARWANQTLLVARDRLADTAARLKRGEPEILWEGKGQILAGLQCRHPFIDRPSTLFTADYVTAESGTGCVHTAPGHGLDDYQLGLRHGLEIYCPVNNHGRYVDDGRMPAELAGLTVAEPPAKDDRPATHLSPANAGVLAILQRTQTLLHQEWIKHSYPHCWRSKTPVVFRAMDQWFVSLDRDGLRERALAAIGQVQWIPNWGENRIRSAVASRPDWCISRQRAWGVPIPAFHHEDGRALLDPAVIRAVADRVATRGTDYWFATPANQLREELPLPPDWRQPSCQPGYDTLDVWIDSGSSHRCVLQRLPQLSWPADLYLEGSDQHRGWFQSSLWTGLVADGAPPYRRVITHGFIVDQDGLKISKSGDKPMTADFFVKKFGADVIRLWISSQDYRDDIPVSEEILNNVAETYRTIRNQIRFQLANRSGFDAATQAVPIDRLWPLDRWLLHQLATLVGPVSEAYAACEFHRVYQLLGKFCTVTLSATYHSLVKDRLYTFATGSSARRSAQTVIDRSFDVLHRLLAPILVFTADEAHSFAGGGEWLENSVHRLPWPVPPADWLAPEIAGEVDRLLALAPTANEKMEALRQSKRIGRSLDAALVVEGPAEEETMRLLRRYEEHLPEFYGVSRVELRDGPAGMLPTFTAAPAGGANCPRCWRWVEALSPTAWGGICPRCQDALAEPPSLHQP